MTVDVISQPLTMIYSEYITDSEVPNGCKMANVNVLFKKVVKNVLEIKFL